MLRTTSLVQAESIRDLLLLEIQPSDLWNDENNNKLVEIGSDVMELGLFFIRAIYLFNTPAKARKVYTLVNNKLTPSISGKVSLHSCPDNGTVPYWNGCKKDSIAGYVEQVWP